MRTGYACSLFCLTSFLTTFTAARTTFVLHDKFVGYDFYSAFQWETADDPTNGRVNYVDQDTARKNNLSEGAVLRLFLSSKFYSLYSHRFQILHAC